uniref:C2H2-type domain-containing protein n=1 Tax=Biomphalaria glabrata TaxID=6526 RepID=A0A2C9LMX8_BIOGL
PQWGAAIQVCLLQQVFHSLQHTEDTHTSTFRGEAFQGEVTWGTQGEGHTRVRDTGTRGEGHSRVRDTGTQGEGERSFKCKFCGKAFASHAAHDSHVRRTHSLDKRAPCDSCGEEFSPECELHRHPLSHM